MQGKKQQTQKQAGKEQSMPKEDFLIESLKVVVDGIAQTFGRHCEVTLHDFRDMSKIDRSIVKIEHGHITGRTIRSGVSDRALRDIRSGVKESLFINYESINKQGKTLKSSTIMLRNEEGTPIAALCINRDIMDILNFNAAIQDILGISDDIRVEPSETFQSEIGGTLNEIVDGTMKKVNKAITLMDKNDKIEIVRQLEEQGFFLIKGAVMLLARKLSLSKYTIYHYLQQIRIEKNEVNG